MTLVEWVVNSFIFAGMCFFAYLIGYYGRDYINTQDSGILAILVIVIVNCLMFGYNMHNTLTLIKGRF